MAPTTAASTAYGYNAGEEGLEIIRHQAEIVRRIFAEFVAGKSQTAIAQNLNREKRPDRTQGGKWLPSTIRGILTNPAYIGKVRVNGEVFPGLHAAIIDEKAWQQAQDLFAAAPERRGRHPKGRTYSEAASPLRQLRRGDGPPDQGQQRAYYCDGH